MYLDTRMDSLSSLKSIKRHYKKDSRYVNDLYTLTYDNHESLENTVELISSLYFRTDLIDKHNESPKLLNAGERLIRNTNLQYRLSKARDDALKQSQCEEKQQGVPSLSCFIKQTLKKVDREQHPTTITRFTPRLLSTMNVTQLQIVVNEIYDFRGVLNEFLVKSLMERDELLSKRDSMLMTIEKSGVKI